MEAQEINRQMVSQSQERDRRAPKRNKSKRGQANKYRREHIGKRVRFEVFARDGFSCRYCGRQSDTVQLVIDHLNPVCNGGGSEPENLITSCVDCNSGKGGKTLEQHTPTDQDRLRLFQEHHEQTQQFESAKAAVAVRDGIRQLITDHFLSATGLESANITTVNILCSYARRYGVEVVFDWIEIAAGRLSKNRFHRNYDTDVGMYISGIKRSLVKEGKLNA
jgi:5-methylcytosine-specific restriction endonuclease McrA